MPFVLERPVILHKYVNKLKPTELVTYTILLIRAIATGNGPDKARFSMTKCILTVFNIRNAAVFRQISYGILIKVGSENMYLKSVVATCNLQNPIPLCSQWFVC